MIYTDILTDDEALDVILKAAEKLYKPVSTTMGPRGKNVIFRKYGKQVGVTHDGVTVAKLTTSNDEAEDAVIDVIRESAKKLDSTTGDGTTTVTVLTYNILKEAVAAVKAGEHPMKLKLELDKLVPLVLREIEKHTDKNVTVTKLKDIATTSAGSRDIGDQVGAIVHEAGPDTPILLGFSERDETFAEVINGFKLDVGPASPYLLSGSVRQELQTPYVAVVDAKLRDKDDILPLLKVIAQHIDDSERRVLIICSDIAGDALNYVVMNHVKGFAQMACARVPQHVKSHSDYLADLAVAVGATVLSRNTGASIRQPAIDHFGRADKVTVQPLETVIVGGHRVDEDFNARVAELEDLKDNHESAAVRKFADDRLKNLQQKIVSIFVGGQSESDAIERHYRYEDAVGASRAALRAGIVPGGGTLLTVAADAVAKQGAAGAALAAALRAPLLKVWSNAGINAEDYIKQVKVGKGIDVLFPEDGIVDLAKQGIVDPAESEIESVKTAVAIAGLLLTCGAEIIDRGEPDEQASQPFSANQN